MAPRKLTDNLCQRQRPHTGRIEIADAACPGLELRISAGGTRTFSYRFRDPTKANKPIQRMGIGTYPTTSLRDARKRADELRKVIEAGGNPLQVRQQIIQDAPKRTFEHLAGRYLTEHADRKKRPRSAEEDRRNLGVHVLPKWRRRDYHTITRADVVELIEGIVSDGKHTAANRVHALISKVFNFGIDAGIADSNPAMRLAKRGVENASRRVLDDDEIRLFWKSAIRRPLSQPLGLALRLALLTGARINEIAGMRKSELRALNEPSNAAWIIPGERAKNKREHLLPLSPLAVETIGAAIELTDDNDEFVFPTRLARGGPIDRHALTSAMRRFGDALKGNLPAIKTWKADAPSPHDLRRTINTRLASLSVPKEIRDRVLNHINAQRDPESRHYNLHEFAAEKRAALNQWADTLGTIIDTAPVVVPLKRRAR
jgi:integrase